MPALNIGHLTLPASPAPAIEVHVGEWWTAKHSDPWEPERYQIVATKPGWVRLQFEGEGRMRAERIADLFACYERDRDYEADQAGIRG
jgi:hypothetical protein